MVKETDHQLKIIQSAKKQGGYGKKWSSAYTVGVPDLVLSFPNIGIFLMEVKYEKDLTERFDRKLDITEKQRHELKMYHEAGGFCILGVIMEYRKFKTRYLAMAPWYQERLSSNDMDKWWVSPWNPVNGFNVKDCAYALKGVYKR